MRFFFLFVLVKTYTRELAWRPTGIIKDAFISTGWSVIKLILTFFCKTTREQHSPWQNEIVLIFAVFCLRMLCLPTNKLNASVSSLSMSLWYFNTYDSCWIVPQYDEHYHVSFSKLGWNNDLPVAIAIAEKKVGFFFFFYGNDLVILGLPRAFPLAGLRHS